MDSFVTQLPGNDGSNKSRVWVARLLVGAVLASNLYAAILFIWQPASFAVAFQLSGASGDAALRGIGVLFLMWNVPYAVALTHPVRQRTSLWEATAMQSIGVLGESLVLLGLPVELDIARQSILRFIVFDVVGLICLLTALWICRRIHVNPSD